MLIIIMAIAAVIICIAIVAFLLYFYRDPVRAIPKGDVMVSPADGRIISIIKTGEDSLRIKKGFAGRIKTLTTDLGKGQFTAVSIFMSPLDVHVNRVPLDGKVISVRHSKGKFFNASIPEAFENEKTEIIISSGIGKIKVIQIAGFIARRIETYVRQKTIVKKGERIGMIKLGSQVTLIMPAGKVRLKIKKGQKVKAGSSIIGEII